MKTRKATIEDFEQLSDIFYDSDAYHHEKDPIHNQKPKKYIRDKQAVNGWIDSKDSEIIVVETDEKVVGLIVMTIRTQEHATVFKGKEYFYLGDVGVKKEYWGKGIGSVLMKQVLKQADVRGIDTVRLRVDLFNENAVKLYKKFGFDITSYNMELIID